MFVKVWPFKTYSALPAEFSFSRADPATHYNSAGLLVTAAINAPRFDFNPATLEPLGLFLEGAGENVCLQSEDVTTTWTTSLTTVASNTVLAPDGTMTGDTILEDGTTGTHYIQQAITGLTDNADHTQSAFLQAGTRNWVALLLQNKAGAFNYAYFDLSAGVTGFKSAGAITSDIEDIGGGWYRCSFTSNIGVGATVPKFEIHIGEADNDNIFTGLTASSLYTWGMQLEEDVWVSSYIKTTVAAVSRAGDFPSMGPTGGLPFTGYNPLEGAFSIEWDSVRVPAAGTQFLFNLNDGTTNNRINITPSTTNVRFYATVAGAAQIGVTLMGPSITADTPIISGFSYKLNDYVYGGDGAPPRTDTVALVPTVDRVHLGVQAGAGNLPMWGHVAELTYFDAHLPPSQIAEITTHLQNYLRSSQAAMQVATDADGITASSQAAMQAATLADGIPASSQAAMLVAHYPDATEAVRDAQLLLQAATKDLTGKPASTQQAMLVAYRTGTVENLLNRAWTFTLDGHTFYVITLGEQGTFVFDRTTEQWAKWLTYGMPVWNMEIGLTWKGNIIAADQSNPVIWELEPRSFLDDDFKPMQRVVTGGLPVRGRDYVENYAFRITASLGKFDLPVTIPATVATVRLRFSDDQGKTFTDAGILTMKAGDWVQELAWTSLGSMHAPGRLFEVSDEGAVTRIDDADAENGDNG